MLCFTCLLPSRASRAPHEVNGRWISNIFLTAIHLGLLQSTRQTPGRDSTGTYRYLIFHSKKVLKFQSIQAALVVLVTQTAGTLYATGAHLQMDFKNTPSLPLFKVHSSTCIFPCRDSTCTARHWSPPLPGRAGCAERAGGGERDPGVGWQSGSHRCDRAALGLPGFSLGLVKDFLGKSKQLNTLINNAGQYFPYLHTARGNRPCLFPLAVLANLSRRVAFLRLMILPMGTMLTSGSRTMK